MPALGEAAAQAEAHDGKGSGDVRIRARMTWARSAMMRGIGKRSARRRLHDDHQVALIFLRNEAGGHVVYIHRWRPGREKDQHQQQIAQLAARTWMSRRRCGEPADTSASMPCAKAEKARESGRMCRKSS
jgi:hypothetical protein